MKSTLIGEAADADDVRLIREHIETDPAVVELADLRTELLGPDDVLVVGTVTVHAASAAELRDVSTRLEGGVRLAVPTAHLIYLQLSPAACPPQARRHDRGSP